MKDRKAWIPARIKLSAYGFIGIFLMMAMAKYTMLAEIESPILLQRNKSFDNLFYPLNLIKF